MKNYKIQYLNTRSNWMSGTEHQMHASRINRYHLKRYLRVISAHILSLRQLNDVPNIELLSKGISFRTFQLKKMYMFVGVANYLKTQSRLTDLIPEHFDDHDIQNYIWRVVTHDKPIEVLMFMKPEDHCNHNSMKTIDWNTEKKEFAKAMGKRWDNLKKWTKENLCVYKEENHLQIRWKYYDYKLMSKRIRHNFSHLIVSTFINKFSTNKIQHISDDNTNTGIKFIEISTTPKNNKNNYENNIEQNTNYIRNINSKNRFYYNKAENGHLIRRKKKQRWWRNVWNSTRNLLF